MNTIIAILILAVVMLTVFVSLLSWRIKETKKSFDDRLSSYNYSLYQLQSIVLSQFDILSESDGILTKLGMEMRQTHPLSTVKRLYDANPIPIKELPKRLIELENYIGIKWNVKLGTKKEGYVELPKKEEKK